MDGWMDAIDRDRSIDRCDANDAVDRTIDAAERPIDRPRDGRGTDAHPGQAPTGVSFYFYDGQTDGRTDGRTARERFENVILSGRSKPFARVGIYIRLMYGTVCTHARATDEMLSTLKNPKP